MSEHLVAEARELHPEAEKLVQQAVAANWDGSRIRAILQILKENLPTILDLIALIRGGLQPK